MSDEDTPVVTAEKKRGRPGAADKEKAVEAKKRPRSSSSDTSDSKKVVENGNVPAKRGRGRPKAVSKASTTKVRAEKKSSRGRGRPKAGKKAKSSSSESEEDDDDDEEEDNEDAEDSDEFYFQFHLTKPLVRLLISDIREFAPPPRSISGIPLELKVLVFLNFLASGGYQKRVGSTFLLQLSQASVSRIVDEMSRIVAVNLKSRYIIFPSTVEEVNKKKEGFRTKYHINGIVGAIDNTHVPLSALPKRIARNYFNRRGFYSVNVMLICDSDQFIMNVKSDFCGGAHDAHIYGVSRIARYLKSKYNYLNNQTYLLGDAGFPLTPWLITPFREITSIDEANFNKMHSIARNVIEKTNGLMKQVFRSLNSERKFRYAPHKASQFIISCCVLHNMKVVARMLARDGPVQMPLSYTEVPDCPQSENSLLETGNLVRHRLVPQFLQAYNLHRRT